MVLNHILFWSAQALRLFLVWDSEGIAEEEDRVLEQIFESVDADDSDDDGSEDKGKKKSKKGKGKKRDRSSSSSCDKSSDSSAKAI